jgi:dipeptidyl-peptidase-4
MRPLIDNQKLVKELTSIINRDDTTMFFDWPKSFSSSGQYGLYIYEGDIFILDINSSKFLRITDTPIKEKSARFSPDGKNIAFIRENDLYTYNIKKKQEKRLTYNGSETILNGTVSWVYWEEIFGRQDIGYWWSDDSRALAYLQTDESPVTKMHYVHWKPEEPKLITQRYPKAGTANPIVKLGIIEISTPKTKWVDLESFEYLCSGYLIIND